MAKDIEPIDANFDDVARKMVATSFGNKNKDLQVKNSIALAAPKQGVLDLGVEVERIVAGVEMGVLENGLPYLTQRGLAEMSGASRKAIFDVTQEWAEAQQTGIFPRGRMTFFRDYLSKAGFDESQLYIEIMKDSSPHYAYPDVVCMAIIEYYTFEAQVKNETALTSFRNLARFGMQQFIYEALGYSLPDKWKYHHDRISLVQNAAPDGYFIIFNEVSGLIVDLITADLPVNDKTIPDISVGRCWGDHWNGNGFDVTYGPRIEYDHNYPSYYPQSAKNPLPAKAYPNAALPEFRRWFRHDYLTTRFPKYILTKAHLLGGQEQAKQIGNLYQPKQLERPK